MKTQEQINKETYLHPPTVEQIEAFVKKCKVSYYRFESFFGIPKGTIKVVRAGQTPFPAKYWHIIYEEIIPTYGTGVKNPEKIRFKQKTVKTLVKTPTPELSENKDVLSINELGDVSKVNNEDMGKDSNQQPLIDNKLERLPEVKREINHPLLNKLK